jgi:hypothetical protein
MTIIDVPFEPFVRHGENLVSYWNISAAHTHYVEARGNAGIEHSLEIGVLSRKGIRYARFITGTADFGWRANKLSLLQTLQDPL